MKVRNLLVILLFCVVLRGMATAALHYFLSDEKNIDAIYYLSFIVQGAMYALLVYIGFHECGLNRFSFTKVIGRAQDWKKICFASFFGVTLFFFAIGENSLEVWSVAQYDENLAQFVSGFYTPNRPPATYSSAIEILPFFFMGIIIAPAAEELFFRGLLFQASCHRMRFASAALLTSAVFTVVHINHLHVVSTLMFSMCLCYILKITHSLTLCIAAHSGFNLVALTAETFFGKTFLQAPEDIRSFSAWLPYFSILVISSLIILSVVKNGKKYLGRGERIPLRHDRIAGPIATQK